MLVPERKGFFLNGMPFSETNSALLS